MNKELLGAVSIACVHADLDHWAALDVGFDNGGNLAFEMDYDCINVARDGWRKRITVDRKDLDTIAQKMRVAMVQLPEAFFDIFGAEEELWNVSGVFDRFNEIENYISCLRLHYRFEKIRK